MSMEFELKMDARTMGRFLLHYNYTRLTGVLGIILGVSSVGVLFGRFAMWSARERVVWAVIAFMFLVMQPLALWSKGKRQAAQEAMQQPLICHIDDVGLTVTQGEASSECKWNNVRKIVFRKHEIYIYTSAIYATIITEESCKDRFAELAAFLKEKKK